MKHNIIIIITGFIALASLSISIYLFIDKEKTGYVAVQDVYDQFVYKKELEKEYNSVKEKRNNMLDSLRFKIQTMNNTPEHEQDLHILKKEYYMKQKQFEEENQRLSRAMNEKILNQLNQYVRNYGEAHGYDYIFGSMNDGTIMHAPESKNLTNEVITYINNQYQGQ